MLSLDTCGWVGLCIHPSFPTSACVAVWRVGTPSLYSLQAGDPHTLPSVADIALGSSSLVHKHTLKLYPSRDYVLVQWYKSVS